MSKVEILEDRTFFAGDRKTLWRVQVIREERGMAVKLMRVGFRGVAMIMFPYLELPDIVEHISNIKIKLEGSKL